MMLVNGVWSIVVTVSVGPLCVHCAVVSDDAIVKGVWSIVVTICGITVFTVQWSLVVLVKGVWSIVQCHCMWDHCVFTVQCMVSDDAS